MAEYGKYSDNRSIIARYERGKLIHIYENVIAETVFLQEDYHKSGKHIVGFDLDMNGRKIHTCFNVEEKTSFQIFPSWMKEKLEKNLEK